MDTPENKTCRICGVEKPLSEYYKHERAKGGVHPWCKACFLARARARRLANLAAARAYDRERYAKNAKRKAQQKATARRLYAANREKHLAQKRAYYLANTERFAQWRAKRNATKKSVEHQPYTRREIFERDGGQCRICGKTLKFGPGGFSLDHIVPLALGGPDTPANLQLTCQPCNREKWMNLEGQIHLPV